MKISKKDVFVFILAGGKGTRFWPLSRKDAPKQFLHIFNYQSMLQKTYRRLKSFISSEQIYIITSSSQVQTIKKQLPDFNKKNFIIEPEVRGTAVAIGLAAISIKRKNPENLMIVVPADHYIKGEKEFKNVLKRAISAAASSDTLVTIAIKPTYPSTGYGYLKFGKKLKISSGYVYKLDKFVEKPSKMRALKFISSKKYYFNSGMFIWKGATFLKELQIHMPNLYKSLLRIDKVNKSIFNKKFKLISSIYKKLKPISIDYGLMQKTNNIIGIRATFKWSDLGSLKSLEEINLKKVNSNIVIGASNVRDNTKDCIIYGRNNHLIATIGISELIIVQTPDITLVAYKEDAQKIRNIVNKISKDKKLKKFI